MAIFSVEDVGLQGSEIEFISVTVHQHPHLHLIRPASSETLQLTDLLVNSWGIGERLQIWVMLSPGMFPVNGCAPLSSHPVPQIYREIDFLHM